MEKSSMRMSLLDAVIIQTRCQRPNDLGSLCRLQRIELARAVEKLDAEMAELGEWNEVLTYIAHVPGEKDQKDARKKLIELLLLPPHEML